MARAVRDIRAMRFRANSPFVISETIQGETIIIHLNTGTYYSLQGSGAEVWESIAGAATAPEIAADLAARYAVSAAEAETTVAALMDDLRNEELIVASDATERDTIPAAAAAGGAFVAPSLSKFTDMQDLVLLDPVHEVSETGWPQAAGA
jgi:Coenzyme PQQ synthesis protein D (PqqD)